MLKVSDIVQIDFWDFGMTKFEIVEVNPHDSWGFKKGDYKVKFLNKGTGFVFLNNADLPK